MRRLRRWLSENQRIVLITLIFLGTVTAYLLPISFTVDPSEQTENAHQWVEQVPTYGIVLVCWEGQRTEGLEYAFRALTEHLLDRHLRPVLITFFEESPSEMRNVWKNILSARTGLRRGRDYLNVGLIPGGAEAMRSFVKEPLLTLKNRSALDSETLSSPLVKDLSSKGSVVLTVVIGEDTEHGFPFQQYSQVFGEQRTPLVAVTPGLGTGGEEIIAFGGFQGIVDGVTGAAEYEHLRGQKGPATRHLKSISVISVLLVGLIVGVAVGGLFSEGLRPNRGRQRNSRDVPHDGRIR